MKISYRLSTTSLGIEILIICTGVCYWDVITDGHVVLVVDYLAEDVGVEVVACVGIWDHV